jgi:hypothetical protein
MQVPRCGALGDALCRDAVPRDASSCCRELSRGHTYELTRVHAGAAVCRCCHRRRCCGCCCECVQCLRWTCFAATAVVLATAIVWFLMRLTGDLGSGLRAPALAPRTPALVALANSAWLATAQTLLECLNCSLLWSTCYYLGARFGIDPCLLST